jgi:hypothetical protein
MKKNIMNMEDNYPNDDDRMLIGKWWTGIKLSNSNNQRSNWSSVECIWSNSSFMGCPDKYEMEIYDRWPVDGISEMIIGRGSRSSTRAEEWQWWINDLKR